MMIMIRCRELAIPADYFSLLDWYELPQGLRECKAITSLILLRSVSFLEILLSEQRSKLTS